MTAAPAPGAPPSYGLTIRWTLLGTPEGTGAALRAHVEQESAAGPTEPGLHSTLWQLVDGGFFACVQVWESAQARTDHLERFRARPSRLSQLVGHDPDSVQEWDLVGRLDAA